MESSSPLQDEPTDDLSTVELVQTIVDCLLLFFSCFATIRIYR